jgi:hypothetical protein
LRNGFTKEGAGQRGADELGRFVAGHDHDGHDGNPATEFGVAKERNGVAHAANLAAKTEQRGIEVPDELVNDGRVVLKQGLDFVM